MMISSGLEPVVWSVETKTGREVIPHFRVNAGEGNYQPFLPKKNVTTM
jgi:hypothetical protein